MQRDAVAQTMHRHVAPRESQRAGGKIDGIDMSTREGQRRQDREAARAGTQIENTARPSHRQAAVGQQVADKGARDQGTFVGEETYALHVGRTDQVGRRQPERDAGVDQRQQARALRRRRFEIEQGLMSWIGSLSASSSRKAASSTALVVPCP